MIFTLGYARQNLAKFVDSGAGANNPAVIQRINDAIMQLLMMADWQHSVQRMRFFTTKNVIVLPFFAERFIKAKRDHAVDCTRGLSAGRIWSQHYEFLENGPLTTIGGTLGGLIDWGDRWPTMYEVPVEKTVYLCAFSTAAADAAQNVFVRGFTTGNHEIMVGGLPGASFRINYWKGGVEGTMDMNSLVRMSTPIVEVTSLQKPITQGFVTLMAIDPVTGETWFLAKYHPQETTPQFRKYKVQEPNCDDGSAWTALVKLRYVPAVYDTDPLLIQNIPALKHMLQALAAMDAGNLALGRDLKTEALFILGRQLATSETPENEIQIEGDFALGGVRDS